MVAMCRAHTFGNSLHGVNIKKLLPDKVRQQLFNFLRSCQRRFAFFLVLVPAFFFEASL